MNAGHGRGHWVSSRCSDRCFGEGEPWRNAVFAGVGTFLVIWLIFTKLLELPLFSGLLLPALF